MMFAAAAVEMVNVVRTQTGGPPRHPEEAAESERDYPEQGQAAPGAAAGGSRLRAGPEEPPHPPGHGRASSGGAAAPAKEANFGQRYTHKAPVGAQRTRRTISSCLRESCRGSFSPGRLLPKTIRDIVRGGESGASAKEVEEGRNPALEQALVSAFFFPEAAVHEQ